MKTFNQIAKAHGVTKRAVQGWWSKAKAEHGELGEIVSGARCFTDDEAATLTSYSSNRAAPQMYIEDEALPDEVEVVAVDRIDFDMGSAIAHLDGSAGLAYEDSSQVVDVIEALCSQVAGGLAAKVRRQEEQLQADRAQMFRAEAIAEQFERTAARLKQRAITVSEEQTEVTAGVAAVTQKITSLGKKPGKPAEGTP